jgi:hypothetical protein
MRQGGIDGLRAAHRPLHLKGAQVNRTEQETKRASSSIARLSAVACLLLALGLIAASSASASFEQVKTFAKSGESQQLGEAQGGLAVNVTGAGGVPAGTIYAANARHADILSYGPDGEFRSSWGWGVAEGSGNFFQRCGPAGEPAYPECASPSTATDWGGSGGQGVAQITEAVGVAVDQATGNVYVLNTAGANHQHGAVMVFSANGSLITEFGDAYTIFGESFEEGPEKFHGESPNGIAVDDSGVIYVSDIKTNTPERPGSESRIMVFEPESPGDYEHYVYTGRANDIKGISGELALDSADHLYVGRESSIREIAVDNPGSPICEFNLAAGGIRTFTVNPATGELFYFSYKTHKITQLNTCNSAKEFTARNSFTVTPKTEQIEALTVNPSRVFSPGRPAGVLYAVDSAYHAETEELGLGDIFAPAEESPPSVESESVTGVTSTTATLNAQINPKSFQTGYVFQYLTEAEYDANSPSDRFAGAAEAPAGGGVLGGGTVTLGAATAVVGLLPDTIYRFRVVATSHCSPGDESHICEVAGEAASFHTFPATAPGLPDGRVYELVSPAFKSGGEVFPADSGKASCNECKPGDLAQRFPMQSAPDGESVVYEGQPFSVGEGAPLYNEYLSKRTASGWQTTTLAPKLMGGEEQGYRAFNASLTQGVLYQFAPSLTPDAPSEYSNLYNQQTAAPTELSPLVENAPPNRSTGAHFRLAYAGSSADLSRQFFAANDALTGPTPVAPEAVDPGETKKNLYEASNGELRLVNVLPGNTQTAAGAHFGTPAINVGNFDNSISDTSHAISEDGSRAFWSDESGQVYVRVDGETTIEVPDPAKFLSASADGSKVLLQDGHIYDLETEATTDLTEGHGGFLGMVGQSEDLSHIYFVDTAVLTGGEENSHGDKATAGKDNLYAWQEGSLAFLGTLLPGDNNLRAGGDWHISLVQRTAQASPSGRLLAFVSSAPLTGYDNVGACGNKGASAPCTEVFVYDSASGKLSCPSCNPTGEVPVGSSSLPLMPQLAGEDPQLPIRYLTEEGRLYFDSEDSLSPFDTNDGVEDVYQYEPSGMGTCKRESGCLGLISAGHEPIDSNFLATDASAKNVFFTTRDQLVLKDKDELYDLYDAREGGGIAAETETARGECQGEACQQAVSPPNDPTPGSSTFEGAGNVNEQKAAKKHAKRHKKHAKKKHKKHAHKRAAKHNRGGNR